MRTFLDDDDEGKVLEDDPMCGVTTGGREECVWDCEVINFAESDGFVTSTGSSVLAGVTFKNPLCLEDCFAKDHCVTKLFTDFKAAGGICDGASIVKGLEEYTFAPEGTCNLRPGAIGPHIDFIFRGICSHETERALRDPKCIFDASARGPTYWETIWRLITLTCNSFVQLKWRNPSQWLLQGRPQQFKLNPIIGIIQHPSYGEIGNWVPEFKNTKNRYPWICSLRSKQQNKTHFCAATLLKRPPGPIVLITTAHCTYLCKSRDGNVRPNCCCENVRKGFNM